MTTKFTGALAALLLTAGLAAGPVLAQELVPGHGAAPSPSTKAAVANAIAASEGVDPLPAGAPTDDYEFMGWCTGILTGHMELYTKVKPQLDIIAKRWNSVDEDNKQQAAQQIEGRALLSRFRKVMATAEAAKPRLGPTGQAAIQKGLDNWSGIDKVDKQAQAYSWMNFGLPLQCETKVAAFEKTPINVAKIAVTTPAQAAAPPAKTKATAAKKTAPAPGAPKYSSLDDFLNNGSSNPSSTGVAADKKKAEKATTGKQASKTPSAADAGLRP